MCGVRMILLLSGAAPRLFLTRPKHLVIRGLYQYVRNPMYLGAFAAVSGQALIYGSPVVLGYALVLAILFTTFVIVYEEPHLRKKFGDDYFVYCQRVNRWWPRF